MTAYSKKEIVTGFEACVCGMGSMQAEGMSRIYNQLWSIKCYKNSKEISVDKIN